MFNCDQTPSTKVKALKVLQGNTVISQTFPELLQTPLKNNSTKTSAEKHLFYSFLAAFTILQRLTGQRQNISCQSNSFVLLIYRHKWENLLQVHLLTSTIIQAVTKFHIYFTHLKNGPNLCPHQIKHFRSRSDIMDQKS